MTQRVPIHAKNPEPRYVEQAALSLKSGGIVAYPTDSGYALGCRLEDVAAVDRIRHIRELDKNHNFTLVCADLSMIGQYAKVDKSIFRLLKAYTPGPYTFILNGTSLVPRRLRHPKRKTIGIRIPNHVFVQALLELMGEPIMSVSLILAGSDEYVHYTDYLFEHLEGKVDLFIDAGDSPKLPSTVVDLTGPEPVVIRRGQGSFLLR